MAELPELIVPGFRAVRPLSTRGDCEVWSAMREGAASEAPTHVLRLDRGPDAAGAVAELVALFNVCHPRIAPLDAHGPLPEGGYWLARPWIEGRILDSWARGHTPEEIGCLVACLTSALDSVHEAGFVHADIKASNVVVDGEGKPTLVDFAFSHRAANQSGGGSYYAASPETLLGAPASPASDLFALGVLLHGLLVPGRRPAREFYADFPRLSFLDAAGTPPETLPEWSRDLIVALTARDPGRRPGSAGVVGRSLAARLGIPYEGRSAGSNLRLPAGFGRSAWMQRELRELGSAPVAWSLRSGEDGPTLFESIRVGAALSGTRVCAQVVSGQSDFITDAVARDTWARGLAATDADLILVSVVDCAVHAGALLCALKGAVDQAVQGARGSSLGLGALVSSRTSLPSEWRESVVPPVEPGQLLGFLEEHVDGDPALLERFTGSLVEVAHGSAAQIEVLLQVALERGALLVGERGLAINPNVELDARAWPSIGADLEDGATSLEHDLLGIVALCGGTITRMELERISDGENVEDGLRHLLQARRIRVDAEGFSLVAPARPRLALIERTRSLHRRLATEGSGVLSVAHVLVGNPGPQAVVDWFEALTDLAERGQARIGIELVERAESWMAAIGDPQPPRWREEKALLWAAAGQLDVAQRVLAEAPRVDDADALAVRNLVEARVARHEGRSKDVRKLLESASKSDIRAAGELLVEELRELSGQARDGELVAVVLGEGDHVSALERVERGELRPRQGAFARSLASLSLQRTGRGAEARQLARDLLCDAVEEGDQGREAALRVNLATIERRLGHSDRAIRELEQAQEAYLRSGVAGGLAQVKETLGSVLRDRGDLLRAEEMTQEALGLRERLGDSEGAARVRGLLGLILCERGHVRPAIAALEEGVLAMRGAQRRKHAPFLSAKVREQRARLGLAPAEQVDSAPDPRVLMADARCQWFLTKETEAALLAERAQRLAGSLGLKVLAAEALELHAQIAGGASTVVSLPNVDDDDQQLYDHVAQGSSFDGSASHRGDMLGALEALAERMASRGRDDRAARAWCALSARHTDEAKAEAARRRYEEALALCAMGCAESEAASLQRLLLARPDPCPADFTPRPTRRTEEAFEMEIAKLLEINHELLGEEDPEQLLGRIVENAMEVAGAERGFLVLEEEGELRFDTARSSLRGPILEPELEVSASIVREALAAGRAIRVANAAEDPGLASNASVVSLELRSVLCVPMSIDDEVRAALYLDHRLRTAAFDQRAERLVVLLGDQAALAIQKVRRLAELRSLHAQVARRCEIQRVDLEEARRVLVDRSSNTGAGLVGTSPPMEEVRRLIHRFARTALPVLVTGSSGSGKEVVARALHAESPRSEGPFVSENCAAIPATLMESTLFGHEKGAFTGAVRAQGGLFEEAAGGTIFLDEIGELPLELQAKLLRVLETQRVRRIGSAEENEIDFRILAATNRDLQAEVSAGRFREDLYYRLDGLVIRLPDLSERVSDIPLLVQHFLEAEWRRSGIKRRMHPRVLSEISRRPWPGNVRELKNEIERLCVLEEGDLEDPTLLRKMERSSPASEPVPDSILPMAELERRAILNALEKTGGDKREAARLLGISRAKIYQRLKEWGAESD